MSVTSVINKTEINLTPKKKGLAMERYVFNLHSDDGGIQALVEQAGDCYSVALNCEYAGTMARGK